MTDLGKEASRGKAGGEPSDRVLRAKYLDYCSARVAEVLLRLTADDMYVLAQDVARESGTDDEMPSFSTIVRLATERINRQLSLPDYPAWASEYKKDPEKYEQEMIGLWEADLKTSDHGVA